MTMYDVQNLLLIVKMMKMNHNTNNANYGNDIL